MSRGQLRRSTYQSLVTVFYFFFSTPQTTTSLISKKKNYSKACYELFPPFAARDTRQMNKWPRRSWKAPKSAYADSMIKTMESTFKAISASQDDFDRVRKLTLLYRTLPCGESLAPRIYKIFGSTTQFLSFTSDERSSHRKIVRPTTCLLFFLLKIENSTKYLHGSDEPPKHALYTFMAETTWETLKNNRE
jgi:hypothetical protein